MAEPVSRNNTRPAHTAAKIAAAMMLLTVVSKIFGYVREIVLADVYGTSYIVDAYIMAQYIPTIILTGIFTALSTSYMPTYSQVMFDSGRKPGEKYTNQILTLLLIFSGIALVLGLLFSNQLVSIFAHSFPEQTAELTSSFLKVAFGYTFFTAGFGILDSYLKYHNHFLPQIIYGYLFSLCSIAFIFISKYTNVSFLIYGILVAYAIQFIAGAITASKAGLKLRPTMELDQTIKKTVVLAIPVFIGSSLASINTFIDKSLASGLVEGSVSALNYGWELVTSISILTTMIISTIMYPRMTKASAEQNWEYFNTSTKIAMTIILMIAIPCTFGILVYPNEIVKLFFERGAFDASSTALTAPAFFFYGIGLVFTALNTMLIQVFYSVKNTVLPVVCSAIGIAVNIALNFILIGTMQHKGLALATSIAAVVNVIALSIVLNAKYKDIHIFCGLRKLGKIVIAAVISTAISYGIFYAVGLVANEIIALLAAILADVALYYVALKLLKVEELDIFKLILPGNRQADEKE